MRAKARQMVLHDETLAPQQPEAWRFELVLGEDDLEKLMTGRVSCAVMEAAFRALSWKRGDQSWDVYPRPVCAQCHKVIPHE